MRPCGFTDAYTRRLLNVAVRRRGRDDTPARWLFDQWLGGTDNPAPAGLAAQIELPVSDWLGARAAADILALASKGRAFRSLGKLIVRQGGEHVLYGGTLALAAAIAAGSTRTAPRRSRNFSPTRFAD